VNPLDLRATITPVPDTWPPPGQKREPLLEHIRDLWTLSLIVDQIKANLIEQGWFDPQNATH
jgi:hypothetical protein